MTKSLATSTLLLLGAALARVAAGADGTPLVTAVTDRAVYLYWGPVAGGEAGIALYRSEGDGPFERVALVTRITDLARAQAMTGESSDALSPTRRTTPSSPSPRPASRGPAATPGSTLA
jgi:hypothetical protein